MQTRASKRKYAVSDEKETRKSPRLISKSKSNLRKYNGEKECYNSDSVCEELNFSAIARSSKKVNQINRRKNMWTFIKYFVSIYRAHRLIKKALIKEA